MSSPPTAPGLRHYAFLDALRGFAAMGVVAVHTLQNFPLAWGSVVVSWGAYGVQLFYIVSAYSLCLSLDQRGRGEAGVLRQYAVRRLFRIAPLFYLAILLYLIKPWLFPGGTEPWEVFERSWTLEPWHVLVTALFLAGWHYQSINFVVPAGWSIAVESNFYLLLPWLHRWARNWQRALLLILALLLLAAICRRLLYAMVGPSLPAQDTVALGVYAGLWLPTQLPVFALGILIYRALDRGTLEGAAAPARRLLAPLATMALGVALQYLPAMAQKIITPSFAIGIVLLGVFWFVAWFPSGLIVNRLTRYLGKISYSLYLMHLLVVQAAIWFDQAWYVPRIGEQMPFAAALTGVVLVATALASLSYRLVEEPGQALGARLLRRLATPGSGKP